MVRYTKGDILKADVEALVNTVNCVGVMGRGIALQFKRAFPDNFKEYKKACDRKEVQPGKMFVFDTESVINPRYIINFPTKRHWRGKSRIEDIEDGLTSLVNVIEQQGIRSIAIPPLGSGLGGLLWEDVQGRIEAALSNLSDIEVIVYEPGGSPQPEKMVRNKSIPNMTPGRAALVGLMNQYLQGLLDPFVSLLEVHKLMYFMQEAGEPLRLKYLKGPYGPYANELRHVLNKIEGHFVSGYADGGDNPEKQLELVPGAVNDAHEFLRQESGTLERFDRVRDLVSGFETPFGMELLATVHWVVEKEQPHSTEDVISKVHSWNDRKKRFTPRQIHLTLNVLQKKGWIAH